MVEKVEAFFKCESQEIKYFSAITKIILIISYIII